MSDEIRIIRDIFDIFLRKPFFILIPNSNAINIFYCTSIPLFCIFVFLTGQSPQRVECSILLDDFGRFYVRELRRRWSKMKRWSCWNRFLIALLFLSPDLEVQRKRQTGKFSDQLAEQRFDSNSFTNCSTFETPQSWSDSTVFSVYLLLFAWILCWNGLLSEFSRIEFWIVF